MYFDKFSFVVDEAWDHSSAQMTHFEVAALLTPARTRADAAYKELPLDPIG